jgi:hypothetical protein
VAFSYLVIIKSMTHTSRIWQGVERSETCESRIYKKDRKTKEFRRIDWTVFENGILPGARKRAVGPVEARGTGWGGIRKKKKINVLVKECFRAVLLKPVEGMRDRWAG